MHAKSIIIMIYTAMLSKHNNYECEVHFNSHNELLHACKVLISSEILFKLHSNLKHVGWERLI